MYKSVIFIVLSVTGILSGPPILGKAKNENNLHFLYFPAPDQELEIIYNDTQSLSAANLKPGTKTLLIIDGFGAPRFTPMNTATKNAYSRRTDLNVIIVDWSAYSGFGRPIASVEEGLRVYMEILLFEVPKAGEDLADFIQFLSEKSGVGYKDIVLIGHSLGAHTCGATGRASIAKYNQTVGRIVALDPAMQYSSFDGVMRLGIGDADVVEIYTTGRKIAGDNYPATGDITIYVNGGSDQPCQSSSDSEDIGILCDDHSFSWKLYNYLANNDTLKACPCKGAMCYCSGDMCPGFDCGMDGIGVGPYIPENAKGSYHLKTGHLEY